jgi:hypothetical protein
MSWSGIILVIALSRRQRQRIMASQLIVFPQKLYQWIAGGNQINVRLMSDIRLMPEA